MRGIIELLGEAIELEIEGHEFYAKCAERTKSEKGKEMFDFLASEEIEHREKLEHEYRTRMGEDYAPSDVEGSDVFPDEADEKSDELEALNMGIEAERRSIELYESMLGETDEQGTIGMLREIIKDEERHLAILGKEVEFVTETGEYTDFKTVGS